MKVTVIYEETLQISIDKAFELAMQWITSQHKAKIKKHTPPTFIEAKQGTMNTNTGHDPNWKKRIRINFYDLKNNKILIRVEATPLSRTILRVEKLKQSWYNGLFSNLFSLLERIEETITPKNQQIFKDACKKGKEIIVSLKKEDFKKTLKDLSL